MLLCLHMVLLLRGHRHPSTPGHKAMLASAPQLPRKCLPGYSLPLSPQPTVIHRPLHLMALQELLTLAAEPPRPGLAGLLMLFGKRLCLSL